VPHNFEPSTTTLTVRPAVSDKRARSDRSIRTKSRLDKTRTPATMCVAVFKPFRHDSPLNEKNDSPAAASSQDEALWAIDLCRGLNFQ
jgi:hypothetical protein